MDVWAGDILISHICLDIRFLAPSGAQGVTMSVRPSVRLSGTSLSKALNLQSLSLLGLFQVCLRSFSALLAYFAKQTEPKILRLVYNKE